MPGTRELPDREHKRRIEAVRRALGRRGLDALIVHNPHNIFYLTGARFSLAWLLISPREAVLLVDGRYFEAARSQVRHCEVWLMKRLEPSLLKWRARTAPRHIGFEGETAWATIREWQGYLDGCEWEECGEVLRRLRAVKSPAEARALARSAKLNDSVFAEVTDRIVPGMTELDVRRMIRESADRLGAEDLSFDPIVAVGEMSSRPHYHSAPRPLERGRILLIDMGVIVDGYCSDMTRVLALGKRPGQRLERVYEAVLEAEQAAMEAVRPGVTCNDLDAVARDVLKRRRLASRFTHGLGHGVGIEIHESPRLNARTTEPLRAGMAITIEPGVYLPGVGGVRIEDLALVTRKGAKVLSQTPRELRVLPFD